jgi:Receptor family ligand binding region/7 transmembrane sweet-taste receptor of 3 GCPR
MRGMTDGISLAVLILLYYATFISCVNQEIKAAEVVFNLKVGLYANSYLSDGSFSHDGAQSVAGFLMAIKEINRSPTLLPNVHLSVALRGGSGAYGAITAAQSFLTANFSTNSYGRRVSSSSFIRNNPIGVDVILGAGNDIETVQTNQVLNYFKIVQLHTVAMTTDLGIGQNYPFKVQTTPIISYQGLALQHMLCNYFNIAKVTVFATDDNNGLKSVLELESGTYCDIKILSYHTITAGNKDFANAISLAKLSGSRIFVLFMPASSAAPLLEQAYEMGLLEEGTQVFGNSLTIESSICSLFKNPSNAKNIMRGFIGIKYSPLFAVHATSVGRDFAKRFSKQVDTVGIAKDGKKICDNSTDDTNRHLYISKAVGGVGQSECSGLVYSSFLPNGTNMYPFTPHAYDAVYALAQAIQQILLVGGKNTINGDLLHSRLINDIGFNGASGKIKFKNALSENLFYTLGDREVGHTYLLYNFNEAIYDTSRSQDGLVLVAKWSLESGGVASCTSDSQLVKGGNCVAGFTYRNVDNLPCSDTPPAIIVDLPGAIELFLVFMGSAVLLVVTISFCIMLKYSRSRLIKASQPSMIYIIHLGCFLGGVRTIIGGMRYSDSSCRLAFYTGHLTLCVTYLPLLAKIWRLQKVFNNKSLKRLKLSWRLVIASTVAIIFLFAGYLAVAMVVGQPHKSFVTVEEYNQVTNTLNCSYNVPGFQISLYTLELLGIVYSMVLINKIKDIPDPLDDIRFYITGAYVLFKEHYLSIGSLLL